MILVSDIVKNISSEIAVRSLNEANYFPVDRLFLDQFFEEIRSLEEVEFIFHNIEQINPTYANLLFLCLPEIWEKITYDDIKLMIKSFTNPFSYYTLIEFTYKYIKIDVISLIIKCVEKDKEISLAVLEYLTNQWSILIMSDEENEDLENFVGKEFFNYNSEQWLYIRQRLLLDIRIQPALENDFELKQYVRSLYNNINSLRYL